MGHWLIGRTLLATALFSALLVGGVAIGLSNHDAAASASTPYKWKNVVTGQLVTRFVAPHRKPIPFGTTVTIPKDDLDETTGSVSSSFWGRTGYELAYLDGYQYALRSTNSGKTWTINSPYWSGPWADAGAGANYIESFLPSQAVAYGNQWLYVTMDSGKHWYVVDGLESIESVAPSEVEWWRAAPFSSNQIIVNVAVPGSGKNSHNIVSTAQYISSHDGRVWTLLPSNS